MSTLLTLLRAERELVSRARRQPAVAMLQPLLDKLAREPLPAPRPRAAGADDGHAGPRFQSTIRLDEETRAEVVQQTMVRLTQLREGQLSPLLALRREDSPFSTLLTPLTGGGQEPVSTNEIETRLESYVRRMLRNGAMDYWKRRSREGGIREAEGVVRNEQVEQTLASDDPSPEQELEQRQLAKTAEGFLAYVVAHAKEPMRPELKADLERLWGVSQEEFSVAECAEREARARKGGAQATAEEIRTARNRLDQRHKRARERITEAFRAGLQGGEIDRESARPLFELLERIFGALPVVSASDADPRL